MMHNISISVKSVSPIHKLSACLMGHLNYVKASNMPLRSQYLHINAIADDKGEDTSPDLKLSTTSKPRKARSLKKDKVQLETPDESTSPVETASIQLGKRASKSKSSNAVSAETDLGASSKNKTDLDHPRVALNEASCREEEPPATITVPKTKRVRTKKLAAENSTLSEAASSTMTPATSTSTSNPQVFGMGTPWTSQLDGPAVSNASKEMKKSPPVFDPKWLAEDVPLPGGAWDQPRLWVVFSDLHVTSKTLDTCLQVESTRHL
jgi:hypothetical protein